MTAAGDYIIQSDPSTFDYTLQAVKWKAVEDQFQFFWWF